MIIAATHSVGDLLNSAYDVVFILGAFASGLFALWRLISRKFDRQERQLDKQDIVLSSILGVLSEHNARLVKAETRLDSHELFIYGTRRGDPRALDVRNE